MQQTDGEGPVAEIDNDPVHGFACAALGVLQARGAEGDGTVTATVTPEAGPPLTIVYCGPAMPDAVPAAVAGYQLVAEQDPGWTGRHRLRIAAPLPVFELLWNEEEPLRILYFSRGEWEIVLMEAAA